MIEQARLVDLIMGGLGKSTKRYTRINKKETWKETRNKQKQIKAKAKAQ